MRMYHPHHHHLLLLVAAVGGMGCSNALGVAPAPESVVASASQALEDGIPDVAEIKSRALLSGTLSVAERDETLLTLSEALIEQGRGEDALRELADIKPAEQLSDLAQRTSFLKARAFMAQKKWEQALAEFAACPEQEDRVACGKAECYQSLGKTREAILALEAVKNACPAIRLKEVELAIAAGDLKKAETAFAAMRTETGKDEKYQAWNRYLEARLLLAQGKVEQATGGFEEVIRNPKGLPESIYVAAALGLTEARIRTGGLETADNVLEDFIRLRPSSSYLELIFARLDQIYSQEENASDSELEQWVEKEPKRRAALALYYFACMEMRESKTEHALKKFQRFAKANPEHPLATQAYFNAGKILLGNWDLDASLNSFEASMRLSHDPEQLAEAEMMAGIVEFQKREFVLASNRFRSAAGHSERLWEQATFNSAISWLNQGNYDKFLQDYKEISSRFPNSKFRPEMLLEEGLLQARCGDAKARASLQLFLKDFPDHPRVAEAQLALAELAFAGADPSSSSFYLKAALESAGPSQSGVSSETTERAKLLEIFQADGLQPGSGENSTKSARVIELCQKFLRDYPGSDLSDQVRMKLGQVYFRLKDYPNAQTQFETLARENPGSSLWETALFLAGQSSMRSLNTDGVDRAIEIFQQVVEAKKSLRLYARQQQAIAYVRLGKEKDAVILDDEILGANPPADLRFAVLGAKADSLVTIAGKDPQLLNQAIAVYDQLASQPDVTASWRNQALYKKAKCLNSLSRASEAMAVYYDILQSTSTSGPEGPDYTWFYRAGFDAGGALEAQENWKAAIEIYEKLANLLGPRSEEAKKRVDQLRLEHFIWEE